MGTPPKPQGGKPHRPKKGYSMLKRLISWLARPAATPEIAALYRTCIAQARLPVFYDALRVPDTVDGRFDMLLLHVYLVVRRLNDTPDQAQQLFDLMFTDMDRNLREMGVSDISVAKKIKPMFQAFYGRGHVYDEALAAVDDAALAAALNRNIYGGAAPAEALAHLTNYVRAAHRAVAAQDHKAILAGQIIFPPVEI